MNCKHDNLRYTIRSDSLRIAGGRVENYLDENYASVSVDTQPARISVKVKCYDCHYSYERPINIQMSFDNDVRLAAVIMSILTRHLDDTD